MLDRVVRFFEGLVISQILSGFEVHKNQLGQQTRDLVKDGKLLIKKINELLTSSNIGTTKYRLSHYYSDSEGGGFYSILFFFIPDDGEVILIKVEKENGTRVYRYWSIHEESQFVSENLEDFIKKMEDTLLPLLSDFSINNGMMDHYFQNPQV